MKKGDPEERDYYERLGARIKETRESMDPVLCRAHLAYRCDYTHAWTKKVEEGRVRVGVFQLKIIAHVLNVDFEWLAGGEG